VIMGFSTVELMVGERLGEPVGCRRPLKMDRVTVAAPNTFTGDPVSRTNYVVRKSCGATCGSHRSAARGVRSAPACGTAMDGDDATCPTLVQERITPSTAGRRQTHETRPKLGIPVEFIVGQE